MTDIIFGVIILALLGGFVLYVKEVNREKSKLINALIAKTPEQMRDLNLADRVEIKAQKPTEPDLIPMDSLTDEEFDNHIKQMTAK